METNEKGFNLSQDFPLHYFAKTGNFDELDIAFRSNEEEFQRQLNRFDFQGRTVLHYAALGIHAAKGVKCAELIIQFLNELSQNDERRVSIVTKNRRETRRVRKQQWKGDDSADSVKYINIKDIEGNTAIHLAAQMENSEIVQCLLLHSADVLSRNKRGEQTLSLIYQNAPSAVTALLNKSVFYDAAIDSESFSKTERCYCLDFTAVIGNTDLGDQEGKKAVFQETLCLSVVNNKETKVRKEILTHPLVRFFIWKKSEKLRWIILLSLLIQLIWIFFYIWHAVEVYYNCCELGHLKPQLSNETLSVNCADFPFDKILNPVDKSLAYNTVTNCIKNNDSLARSIPIFIFTIYVIITIVVNVMVLRMDYLRIRNAFLSAFVICVLITIIPAVSTFLFQFQMAAFTIVIGSMVILEIVNKHLYWAIYIRVLIKVLQRFLAILPLFLFIILAFSVSMRMLFPTENPPLADFRDAIMDIFATVANGKVEWNEGHVYRQAIDENFKTSGFILFIVFYVTLILLLFRILIGFVVADTKKIQEEEELNEISQDLDEIYLFESIGASKLYKWAGYIKCFSNLLERLREKFIFCKNNEMQMWLPESEIPVNLRKPIRALASKNQVKKREKKRETLLNKKMQLQNVDESFELNKDSIA